MNWLEWNGNKEENRIKAIVQALRVASNWIMHDEPCEELVSELFKEILRTRNSTSFMMLHTPSPSEMGALRLSSLFAKKQGT